MELCLYYNLTFVEFAASIVRQRGGRGARRRILVRTPSQSSRPSQASQRASGGSQRRRDIHMSPGVRARGATSAAARRRLLRRSPPSQRRSEMASLTERFIAIEERRVDAELAVARSQEMFAQGHRLMAEALDRFTNTVGIVAQQIIEAMEHHRAPIN